MILTAWGWRSAARPLQPPGPAPGDAQPQRRCQGPPRPGPCGAPSTFCTRVPGMAVQE